MVERTAECSMGREDKLQVTTLLVLHTMLHCDSAVPCCAVLCCAVLCCAVPCCAVLCPSKRGVRVSLGSGGAGGSVGGSDSQEDYGMDPADFAGAAAHGASAAKRNAFLDGEGGLGLFVCRPGGGGLRGSRSLLHDP